tara:strand:- start:425 stop:1594 length:1170 start_codon:yes stop_codon:yes gene_type:complete
MNIPFHKPLFSDNLNNLINESTRSGWVTTGPVVKKFEEKLSKYLGVENVIALNSCTAALHLGLIAFGLKRGDKFIVPTYTFVATVEVGEYLGASPVFVDSDPNTFNLDLNKVEHLLENDKSNEIKAIIPVHFAGQSVDMERVNFLAKKYNIFIIEDAAHAFETFSNIGKVGNTNFGAAFSFYANKNITTGGEGGAFVTNNSEIANKVRKLSLHGMDKDGWNRFAIGGKWSYDVSELGYKYNMTDISAAFGLDQLEYVDSWHKKRENIVSKYSSEFSKIEGIIIPKNFSSFKHAWHLYVIRIIPQYWRINRNEIISKINEVGIATSVHYIPIHMHSYYIKRYNFRKDDFPVSHELGSTVISLPLYPGLHLDSVEYIIESINKIWLKYSEK